MVVEYKGSKIVFDEKWVSTVSYDEFEAVCLDSKPFKLMLKKQRIEKIKEVYGKFTGNAKKDSKGSKGTAKNVRSNNKGERAGNTSTEQRSDDRREEHQEPEDKTEIQEREIRKEKGKAKS